MSDHLDAVEALRRELDDLPKVPIEKAAELLEISVRTMYRWLAKPLTDFETIRRRGRVYITVRSVTRYMERKQYSPTIVFNLTKKLRHSSQY